MKFYYFLAVTIHLDTVLFAKKEVKTVPVGGLLVDVCLGETCAGSAAAAAAVVVAVAVVVVVDRPARKHKSQSQKKKQTEL